MMKLKRARRSQRSKLQGWMARPLCSMSVLGGGWRGCRTGLREVRNFFHGGEMPDGCNEMVAVLIPKVPQPERIKYLLPISLCNVILQDSIHGGVQ